MILSFDRQNAFNTILEPRILAAIANVALDLATYAKNHTAHGSRSPKLLLDIKHASFQVTNCFEGIEQG